MSPRDSQTWTEGARGREFICQVRKSLDEVESEQHIRFYVACVAARNQWTDSDAPIWRDGRDYALEFSVPKFLTRHREFEGSNGQCFKDVCYDGTNQRRELEQGLDQALYDLRMMGEDMSVLVDNTVAHLGSALFYHKLSKYQHESEWRVAIGMTDTIHPSYRPSEIASGGKHINLPLKPGVLIAVHRRPFANLTKPYIETLLRKKCWGDIPVVDSERLPLVDRP